MTIAFLAGDAGCSAGGVCVPSTAALSSPDRVRGTAAWEASSLLILSIKGTAFSLWGSSWLGVNKNIVAAMHPSIAGGSLGG